MGKSKFKKFKEKAAEKTEAKNGDASYGERAIVQLAKCRDAAEGLDLTVDPGSVGWSEAYASTKMLREDLEAMMLKIADPKKTPNQESAHSTFALELQTIVDDAEAGEITRNRVLGERLRDLCARICEKYMI